MTSASSIIRRTKCDSQIENKVRDMLAVSFITPEKGLNAFEH